MKKSIFVTKQVSDSKVEATSIGRFAKKNLALFATTALVAALFVPYIAHAVIGSITIAGVTGSGTGPYSAHGSWDPTGNQCWTNGQGFHYFINVFDDVNHNGVFDSGTDTVKQTINPAPCNGDFTDPVSNSSDRSLGGNWPASGQTPAPATFTLTAGSHSICSVLEHVNNNGNDIVATDCLDNPVVVPPTTGNIKIVKNTAGGNGTFNFTISGPSNLTPSVVTSGNTGNTGNLSVNPGTYSVGETVPTGWDLTSATCGGNSNKDGNTVFSVTVVTGQTTTCTFTDTARGNITIHKVVSPSTDALFGFTSDVSGNATFNLSGGGTKTMSNVVAGSYTVSENANSNYNTTVSCDNQASGTSSVALSLAAGQSIDCTFTNTLKQAGLTVVKATVPSSDTSTEFGFSLGSGDSNQSFTLVGGGSQHFDLAPGTYSVSENTPLPTDWVNTDVACLNGNTSVDASNIALADGDGVICTFTNTKLAHIVVNKVTNPSEDPTSFHFTTTGKGYNAFSLSDGGSNDQTVLPGTYNVSEDATAGWTLTSHPCVYDNQSVGTASAGGEQLIVAAGDIVTCTFTNTKQLIDPKIVKTASTDSVAPGGELDYTLTVNNLGNGTASNVVVTDVLPSTLNYVSNDAADQSIVVFDSGSHTVTWTIASLAPFGNTGDTVVLHIMTTVSQDASGDIVNTATVTARGDSNQDNNSSTAVSTVTKQRFTLDVSTSGNGQGRVTDGDGFINCTSSGAVDQPAEQLCSHTYDAGASVTLNATADAGSTFADTWTTGPCSGTNTTPCIFTMNANISANAHFSVPSSGGGGCTSNCGGSGNGGDGSHPVPPSDTTGQVLGAQTPYPTPTPQVLAAELPRTGLPVEVLAVILLLAFGITLAPKLSAEKN